MKVLISGYYGFENCGDDAVLECIIAGFRKIGINDITVLSNSPDETKNNYGVNAVYRNSFKKVLNAIKNTDVLISGGGSLIQDKTSSRSLWYYLAIIAFALIFRKKVFIIGQGIGPIEHKYNRWLTAVILRRINRITVRDEDSKLFLEKLNIKKNVVLAADPVVNLDSCDNDHLKDILAKEDINCEKYMVICTREWENTELSRVELAKAIDKISEEYGYKAVFLPFYYKKDEEESEKVANYLKTPYKIIRGKYDPKEILGIIKNSNLLIGVRLHSLIFALVAIVPFIGISYDPKIDGFLKSVGMKVFKIDKFSSDELVNYAEYILEHKEEIVKNLNEHLQKLKTLADNNFKVFDEYLDNEVQK